jgi:hypothetical protein
MFTDNNRVLRIQMQKVSAFAVLLCLVLMNAAFAYFQIELPLSNTEGVPYLKDEVDYSIEGFDIDTGGNYYFLSGKKATLVKISKDKKVVFRKTYAPLHANRIELIGTQLFTFNDQDDSNSLFALSIADGRVLVHHSRIIKNQVNAYYINDSSVIAEVFDYQKRIDMKTKPCFVKFDLAGRLIGQVQNRYDLPPNLYPKEYEDNAVQYMGRWNTAYVFWGYDPEKGIYKFWLENDSATVLVTATFEKKILGKVYYGNPNEHRRLRNGNIYVLGRKEKNAFITEIPLTELFPSMIKNAKDSDVIKDVHPDTIQKKQLYYFK